METDEVKFYYSRIPSHRNIPKKGRPPQRLLKRYFRGDGFVEGIKFPPTSKGGETRCVMIAPDGERYFGSASCSCADNFCYRTGREIALGRASKKKNSL